MYISNTDFPTVYYKISGKGYSSKLSIKVILLKIPLVRFLLTGLSPGLLNSSYFYDIINYTSELLAILKIYKNTIKETHI